jgi:hypothetical protein
LNTQVFTDDQFGTTETTDRKITTDKLHENVYEYVDLDETPSISDISLEAVVHDDNCSLNACRSSIVTPMTAETSTTTRL